MESNNLPQGARQFAEDLARAAGEVMRGHYRLEYTVEQKSDRTPVTEADHLVNELVIEWVKRTYPNHGVLGEEASHNLGADWLWVCDPIDGTAAYMTRVPTSAFSLALVHDGDVKLAIVYMPFTNELFHAEKGAGAWLGQRRLQVSKRGTDKPAVIGGSGSTTSPYLFIDSQPGISMLKEKGWYTINFPGIATTGALIADGSIDGVFYIASYAHDIAAIYLLVTEAGGKVTNLNGNEQRYDGAIQGAIVSNGVIHDELVRMAAVLRGQ